VTPRTLKWTCALVACCCAIVLTAAAWMVATEASSTLKAWATIPDRVAAVQASLDLLPGKVLPSLTQEVDDLGKFLVTRADSQATALREDVLPRVDKIEADVTRLVTSSVNDLAAEVGKANGSISTLVADLRPVLENSAALVKDAKSITGQVDYALPDFLNCEWNQDCVFNRYQGAAKAFENAMLKVPAFVATGQKTNEQMAGIAVDIHSMTTEIDHRYFHPPPMSFGQKVWSGFKNVIFLGASAARIAK
jgi:hypothetical protein